MSWLILITSLHFIPDFFTFSRCREAFFTQSFIDIVKVTQAEIREQLKEDSELFEMKTVQDIVDLIMSKTEKVLANNCV